MRTRHLILLFEFNIILFSLFISPNFATKDVSIDEYFQCREFKNLKLDTDKNNHPFQKVTESQSQIFTKNQGFKSKIPNYPNESIDFSLKYGFFNVGTAHLEFRKDSSCSGAYIAAEAKSSGLVAFFRDIHFRYECCMDTTTGFPMSDSRTLIDNDYKDINTVYYDRLTRNDSTIVYNLEEYSKVVPNNIYDLMTGFYHYRANFIQSKLPNKHVVSIKTFFIDEVRELAISYAGKEIVDTQYGDVECIIIQPSTIVGHFFSSNSDMNIWLTNDGRYIPVKFSVKLNLGTLYGEITNSNYSLKPVN